jgi:hypothetical protein
MPDSSIITVSYGNGIHAAYTHKNYLFNGNDCNSYNTRDLPPDGFHLKDNAYKNKRRPLLSLTTSLQVADEGEGECLQCAHRIKQCFEKYCNRDIAKFINIAKSVHGWRQLPH